MNLDPAIGAEIKKVRPCVILSNNSIGVLPLRVIAPITEYKVQYSHVPWMVKLSCNSVNNLKKVSVIDLFQVRSVSEKRFVTKIGNISDTEFVLCKKALGIVFG